MNKINNSLSISLYNRPEYTKILLYSLSKCYGIENYKIIICCDPGSDEVIDLAKSFKTHQTEVIINKNKLGCGLNIYQCLEIGFSNNNYHIHFEDDTIPGKDCLKYFEWAKEKYIDDEEIFTISAYTQSNNKTEHYHPKKLEIDKVVKRNWFTPWGWATWNNRFEEMKNLWGFDKDKSWDMIVNNFFRKNRFEIAPIISRVQNIGAEMGTHVPNAEWHKENQYNEWWIESIEEYNLNEFYEI